MQRWLSYKQKKINIWAQIKIT